MPFTLGKNLLPIPQPPAGEDPSQPPQQQAGQEKPQRQGDVTLKAPPDVLRSLVTDLANLMHEKGATDSSPDEYFPGQEQAPDMIRRVAAQRAPQQAAPQQFDQEFSVIPETSQQDVERERYVGRLDEIISENKALAENTPTKGEYLREHGEPIRWWHRLIGGAALGGPAGFQREMDRRANESYQDFVAPEERKRQALAEEAATIMKIIPDPTGPQNQPVTVRMFGQEIATTRGGVYQVARAYTELKKAEAVQSSWVDMKDLLPKMFPQSHRVPPRDAVALLKELEESPEKTMQATFLRALDNPRWQQEHPEAMRALEQWWTMERNLKNARLQDSNTRALRARNGKDPKQKYIDPTKQAVDIEKARISAFVVPRETKSGPAMGDARPPGNGAVYDYMQRSGEVPPGEDAMDMILDPSFQNDTRKQEQIAHNWYMWAYKNSPYHQAWYQDALKNQGIYFDGENFRGNYREIADGIELHTQKVAAERAKEAYQTIAQQAEAGDPNAWLVGPPDAQVDLSKMRYADQIDALKKMATAELKRKAFSLLAMHFGDELINERLGMRKRSNPNTAEGLLGWTFGDPSAGGAWEWENSGATGPNDEFYDQETEPGYDPLGMQ
jgi:hypothetical protein